MNLPRSLKLAALAFTSFLCFSGPSGASQLYFTDVDGAANTILRRVNSDGSGLTTLRTGLVHPRSVALDLLHGKIYWMDLGSFLIKRSNLDGSGPAEDITAIDDHSPGIAIDPVAGKLYWTTGDIDRRVRSSNLDGSDVHDIIASGQTYPGAVAIDSVHGKLYWTDAAGHNDGAGSIRRADLDGSSPETLLNGIDEAFGLSCDPVGGKIYWTENATKKVQRANLDGSGLEDLVTGLNGPTTLALDLTARKIYWTDSDHFLPPTRIQKSNLDGSNVETVISGEGFPWGIAIEPGPSVQLIKAVKPQFVDLIVGKNYQLQLSNDSTTWTDQGAPFLAIETTMQYPQYWDVANWNKLFFRVMAKP